MSPSPVIETRASSPPGKACCPPLLREPISASQAIDLARILKALADPTRLRLALIPEAINAVSTMLSARD